MTHNEDYQLVTLLEREDLLQKSVELLNEEWPRSQAAREHSQQRSLRSTPPMAFLLLHLPSNKLIGHARVCLLPNRPDGIWIESVIVIKSERGKGLGKILMNFVEEYCRNLGFKKAYLSTEDKIEFYERCGYKNCERILHSTAATSVFPVFDNIESDIPVSRSSVPFSSSSTGFAPPPPPPPPLALSTPKGISTIDHQYMMKNL